MRSSFSGLDIAYRALQAQQLAIDVLNHNIANANTPGYSRQSAQLKSTPPTSMAAIDHGGRMSQLGSGVAVVDVRRSRNSFVDLQVRSESQTLGQWEKMSDALRQVEALLNEPSDTGLNSLLSKFWGAWQDVANAPQNTAARSALIEQADALASAMNNDWARLASIRTDLDQQIRVASGKVNQIAQRIGVLNASIAQVEAGGQQANDLQDQRDLALDELSNLARITYFETSDGMVNVFLGSHALVVGDRPQKLSADSGADGFAALAWDDDGSAVSITGGQLLGLLQARDVGLPQIVDDLDSLGKELVTRVNGLHRRGVGLDGDTDVDFFTGSGAKDMAINTSLKSNPERVATAESAGLPGDNSVALAIAGLRNDLTMNNGTADFGGFLASTVARLGAESQKAETMADNQRLLVDHLTRQKDSFSGVSLDEEAIQLIQYQRAYQAASRVINIVDEMLDRLINGTGLVGR